MLFLSAFALFVVFAGGLFVIFGLGYPGYKETMMETSRNLNTAIRQKKAMIKESGLIKIQSFPQLKSEYNRVVNEIRENRAERKNTKSGFIITIVVYLVLLVICSFWVYTNL